jgi:hypothetical protein
LIVVIIIADVFMQTPLKFTIAAEAAEVSKQRWMIAEVNIILISVLNFKTMNLFLICIKNTTANIYNL